MGRMAGYHWAVTGAAAAFTVFVALDFGADAWATQSGLGLLTELVGSPSYHSCSDCTAG